MVALYMYVCHCVTVSVLFKSSPVPCLGFGWWALLFVCNRKELQVPSSDCATVAAAVCDAAAYVRSQRRRAAPVA